MARAAHASDRRTRVVHLTSAGKAHITTEFGRHKDAMDRAAHGCRRANAARSSNCSGNLERQPSVSSLKEIRNHENHPDNSSRFRHRHAWEGLEIALWTLQVLVALTFVAARSGKLLGTADMIALFDAVGVGQWFRYVTGSLELLGALVLIVPRKAAVGAVLLACVMAGAVVAHVTVLQTAPTAPLVLFVLTALIAWGRRSSWRISSARKWGSVLKAGTMAQKGVHSDY